MKRIVIGISGATGVIYGIRLLEVLKGMEGVQTDLVITKPGIQTLAYETNYSLDDLKKLCDHFHANQDIAAPISSGSVKTEGMIVAPCSVHTLSAIAQGHTDQLLSRAADVVLKERRRLVLMFRETPLHLGHLRNLLAVTEMGGIIAPPFPAFYHQPKTILDLVDHSIGRVLDLFDLEHELVNRWKSGTAM